MDSQERARRRASERKMVESFKPEYKDEDEDAGRVRMQSGMIRTERLRQDYGCSAFSPGERLLVSWKQTKDHQTRRAASRGTGERGRKRKSRRERIR